MPDMLEGCTASDRLDIASSIIEALQDGMFSPDHATGKEPITFYPEARLGMSALLDCIQDHIKAAKALLRDEKGEDRASIRLGPLSFLRTLL